MTFDQVLSIKEIGRIFLVTLCISLCLHFKWPESAMIYDSSFQISIEFVIAVWVGASLSPIIFEKPISILWDKISPIKEPTLIELALSWGLKSFLGILTSASVMKIYDVKYILNAAILLAICHIIPIGFSYLLSIYNYKLDDAPNLDGTDKDGVAPNPFSGPYTDPISPREVIALFFAAASYTLVASSITGAIVGIKSLIKNEETYALINASLKASQALPSSIMTFFLITIVLMPMLAIAKIYGYYLRFGANESSPIEHNKSKDLIVGLVSFQSFIFAVFIIISLMPFMNSATNTSSLIAAAFILTLAAFMAGGAYELIMGKGNTILTADTQDPA